MTFSPGSTTTWNGTSESFDAVRREDGSSARERSSNEGSVARRARSGRLRVAVEGSPVRVVRLGSHREVGPRVPRSQSGLEPSAAPVDGWIPWTGFVHLCGPWSLSSIESRALASPLRVARTRSRRDLRAELQSRIPIRDLLSRLRRWQSDPEGLSRWIGYQMRRKRLKAAGLDPLVDGLHEGRIPVDAAVDQLQVSYYQTLIRDMFRRHAELAEFDGQSYEQWVEEFRALDLARIEMARGEVATAHYDAIPRNATGGEMAVLRREIEKKRRHKPIRQLLKEAGTAILAIKPVFMMSPISVAQYLEPGASPSTSC